MLHWDFFFLLWWYCLTLAPGIRCPGASSFDHHITCLPGLPPPLGREVTGNLLLFEYHTSIPIHTVHHQRFKSWCQYHLWHRSHRLENSSADHPMNYMLSTPPYIKNSNLVGLEIAGTVCTGNSSQISWQIYIYKVCMKSSVRKFSMYVFWACDDEEWSSRKDAFN